MRVSTIGKPLALETQLDNDFFHSFAHIGGIRRDFLDGTVLASVLVRELANKFTEKALIPKSYSTGKREGVLRKLGRLWNGLG